MKLAAVVFQPRDLERVVAFDQSVRLWDVRSGECLLILEGHRPYVRSVDFGQPREKLLSGAGDGVVRLWGFPNGELLQVFDGHFEQ